MTTGYEQLRRACADISGAVLVEARDEDETTALLETASGLITFASRYTQAVAAAVVRSKVPWVHLTTAGIDPLQRFPPLPTTRLSAGGSVWARPVAEHALALLLALLHGIDRSERDRASARWSRDEAMMHMRSLRKLNILLIGFGRIGRTTARLLRAFDAEVTAVASRSRLEDGVRVHDSIQLRHRLTEAEAAILAVPLTPRSRGLMGRQEFAAMAPGSYFVDVSRGGVTNTGALLQALSTGRLAGAALDVFETEPLPETHPLWQCDNVLITPHVAGFGDVQALDEMASICKRNMEDFMAGRQLRDGIRLSTETGKRERK